MSMHDWTRVEAGVYHDFHLCWVAELMGALNKHVLTQSHYARPEQFSDGEFPHVLPSPIKGRARSLAVRSVEGHRLVSLIEIASWPDGDRGAGVARFVERLVTALQCGIHVLLIDPFPPGEAGPAGLHGAVWRSFSLDPDVPPANQPMTLAAYRAGESIEAYVTRLAVGSPIPDMPLFLTPKKFVPVPLELTYSAAYDGMPEFWRNVIERRPA